MQDIDQETHPTRPTTASGDAIYRIPEQNMDALITRVDKLNRRAKRLHMDALVLATVGEAFETRKRGRGWGRGQADSAGSAGKEVEVEYQVRFVLVTLTGTCPKVNGWAMAATIAHGEDGNILRTVPGFETTLPVRYRDAGTACDHCRTNRQRNDTYVLQAVTGTGTGEWKQVGRNCLADFLRTSDAAGLAEMAELLASLDSEIGEYEEDSGEEGEGFGHVRAYWNTVTFLAQVACCIRADGWCSRGEAKSSYVPKCATVDSALGCLDPVVWRRFSAARQEALTPTPEDVVRAERAIEWARALPADVANDYLWNIRVLANRENVGPREIGLAGSIIAAYNRHLEQVMKAKYERDRPSEYFGTPGERGVFTLTVIGTRDLETEYGLTTLVMFRDAAGNRAKWFCAGAGSAGLDVDQTYVVKASVKKHEEYKGCKQTTLTRVVVYDPEEETRRKAEKVAAKKEAKQARKVQKAQSQLVGQ